MDDDVPRLRGAHQRRDLAAGHADAHAELDRAGKAVGARGLGDQRDHLVRRKHRLVPAGECDGDRIASKGKGVAAMRGDDVDRAADHAPDDGPQLLRAGRAVPRQPLRETGEPGDVEEDGHPLARQVLRTAELRRQRDAGQVGRYHHVIVAANRGGHRENEGADPDSGRRSAAGGGRDGPGKVVVRQRRERPGGRLRASRAAASPASSAPRGSTAAQASAPPSTPQ